MKHRFLLIFLCIAIFPATYSHAQINPHGIPFYKKYTEENFGESGQVWAITTDTSGLMYFGCNYGLKSFDGVKWHSYVNPHSTIVRSLNTSESGKIFYGAESDFGMMRPDGRGGLEFYSFYNKVYGDKEPDFSSVWKTHIADNKIYFQSFEKIFYTHLPIRTDKTDSPENKIYEIYPEKTLFHLSFEVNNKLYVREWEKGLCEIQSDSVPVLLPGGERFAFLRIYLMLPFDETQILIGTREDGFFLYNPDKPQNPFTRFLFDNNELIENSAVYGGVKISENKFALSTLQDGLIIFNKKGKILNHYSSEVGMPAKFILTSFFDKQTGILWYFADEVGIFKMLEQSPLTQWKTRKELQFASPLNFLKTEQNTYLTVTDGLYRLSEEEQKVSRFIPMQELLFPWELYTIKLPEEQKERILLGSQEGVFEISNGSLLPISEIQNVWTLKQSQTDPNTLYIGADNGLFSMEYKNGKFSKLQKNDIVSSNIKSILETEEKIYLGTSSNGVLALDSLNDKNIQLIDSARGLLLWGQDFFLYKINDAIVCSTGKGLFEIKSENDSLFAEEYHYFGKDYSKQGLGVYKIFETKDEYILSVYKGEDTTPEHHLVRFLKGEKLIKDSLFSKLLPQKAALFAYSAEDRIWIGLGKGLYIFNKTIEKNYQQKFHTLIRRVTSNDSVLYLNNIQSDSIPELKYSRNNLFFEYAAPYFEQEENTQYSYRLKGLSNEWSKWTLETKINFTNLPEGDYTFEVKAKNIYNTESSTASISFSILPPWYRTVWAYIAYIIIAGLLVWMIVKLYTRKLRRENEILEQKVQERTIEIREKNAQLQQSNEEILAQRDEIEAQRDELEVQRDTIAVQQESIMDSIRYAGRIQTAVMPPKSHLNTMLGEHFVLFKPRDVVSGDFYWAAQFEEKIVVVAADCTGHGVPGAFMSMLGISFLNEIVLKEKTLQANIILNRLRQNVKSALRQEGKDTDTKDGMDIALLIIDRETKIVQYAGAYNPLYIIRNNELITHKADRMPIGIYIREKDSFTNNEIQLETNDLLYIFSDGFVDQFGGEKGQKLKSGNFKKLLLEIAAQPMNKQKELLNNFFAKWTNLNPETGDTYEQVDDIVIVGLKID